MMGLFNISNEKKEFKELLKSGGIPHSMTFSKYLGGHPNVSGVVEGALTVNKLGIFFDVALANKYFHIAPENIIKAEFKTEEQIHKDVTLTRLIALGIFAFGLKKKKKEVHSYLTITYNENGIENTILFEDKKAGNIVSAIMKARQEYAKNNPTTQQNATTENSDIPDQIRKLSELKDQGILTKEEFETKKAELLAKM